MGQKSVAPRPFAIENLMGPEAVPLFYTEGLKALMMGADTSLAAGYFRHALRLDSTHAPSWYELATLRASDPAEAIPYSRRACLLDTTNTWYKAQLGQLMIGAKEYDSALTVYESLLKLSPENPELYYRLGALYEIQGRPFQAIALLDSAETRFGLMEQLSGLKRQLLINVKLYDRALSEAKALVDNFPYEEENYVALGELYGHMNKDSLARDAYRTALALNPSNVQTLIVANEFYKRTGDNTGFLSTARSLMLNDDLPTETKKLFFGEITSSRDFYRDYYFQIGELASALLLKYPDDYSITELYTSHLIAGGKLDEALRIFKEHLVQGGQPNRKAFNEVLSIEAYLNHPDSVARYSDLALGYWPSDPDLYMRKGAVMSYYMKDYTGAESEYLQALKYAGTDSLRSAIYGALGDNRHQMGDTKNSFRYYERSVRADTTNSMALNNFSYYLSERGERLDLAEQMAVRANRLSPANPTYLDTQAWVYYKQGRYEEAKAILQQALGLDSNASAELLIHYGDVLYALGDNFMAAFYWKKAREKGYDPDSEIETRLKEIEGK